MADLRHVESWVFDLDNTLYPAKCRLFSQIDARMADFICSRIGVEPAEARRLQKLYYTECGTTLAGLMRDHALCPDEFLAYVHDIDRSVVAENPALRTALAALPGRRFIFTNGSVAHAEQTLARLGLEGLFEEIFDIRAAEWTPKPHRGTYEKFLAACCVQAQESVMFEDLAHNLEAAHALGMTTVLVCQDADWFADEPSGKRPARRGEAQADYVHHVTDDLAAFLATVETSAALSFRSEEERADAIDCGA